MSDERLFVGDHVQDREADDERTMVVVGQPPERAHEYTVLVDGNQEKTVADYNEEYPDDDRVLEVTYPGRTDVMLDPGDSYAFPRSRLERVASVHDIEGGEE